MNIPNEDDWSPKLLHEDALTAYDRFFGKSNDEMQEYFYRNVISATNDIRFMPNVPFQYYIYGLCQYVTGTNLNKYEASAAASGFLGLVHEKAESNFPLIKPLLQDLIPVVEFVVKNQCEYGADKDIYGDFSEIMEKISKIIDRNKIL